ncbi:MAG: restriction endonuclease subunit S [Sphingobium sp.]
MTATAPFVSLLSKIVDNRGRTCPTAENGLPLIATNCVKNTTLYPVFEKVRYVDQQTYSTWFRGHPLPGDLIFVCKGSPGQVCVTPDPVNFCIAQDMVAVRADPAKVYPPYLFAALRSDEMQSAIADMHVGTLIPHFKKGDFDKLEVPLPDEPMQRFIGNMYLSLTEKIELNRRMNETLEGMAQAVFRDWFVDFGPTRRKAAGEAEPVAVMGGLTPDPARAAHLAALFPAAFGNDGLPVGWSEGILARLALVNSESWKASNHPAEVEYVDLSNTKWGTIESTARLAWEAAPSRARRIARKGDSIIGTVRPGNGSYAYIGKDGYTVSTGFAVLRPKEGIYTDVIYVAVTAADNITRLANLADGHGGAYPAVNPDVVAATPFPVVPDALLTAFSTFASPLREKIEQAKLENTILAETRDYLLPRLMSGAVRVAPQAEAA